MYESRGLRVSFSTFPVFDSTELQGPGYYDRGRGATSIMREATDRVRSHTSDDVNKELDRQAAVRVREATELDDTELSARIDDLDREWDIERVLQTNASVLGLTGLVLGLAVDKKWLAVPGIVLPFLFQHAVQGWCPPVPVFRRLGYRTRKEIDKEKFALKYLRGDFENVRELRDDVAAFRAVNY